VSSQTTTEKRKVARIVFDRPPLKKLNFWLFTLAGLALGLLIALLLHWFYYGLGDARTDPHGTLAMLTAKECWQWYFVLGAVGLLAGLCFGWGWKRGVNARIEMVEQPSMARRRSSSTAMVRVDYGRRW
jgi:hypothetical protein